MIVGASSIPAFFRNGFDFLVIQIRPFETKIMGFNGWRSGILQEGSRRFVSLDHRSRYNRPRWPAIDRINSRTFPKNQETTPR